MFMEDFENYTVAEKANGSNPMAIVFDAITPKNWAGLFIRSKIQQEFYSEFIIQYSSDGSNWTTYNTFNSGNCTIRTGITDWATPNGLFVNGVPVSDSTWAVEIQFAFTSRWIRIYCQNKDSYYIRLSQFVLTIVDDIYDNASLRYTPHYITPIQYDLTCTPTTVPSFNILVYS
jgi:hypothetical protein